MLALDELLARGRALPSKEFFPQAVEGYRYNGRTFGLPYGLTTEVITYNKGLLDKSGVKYPTRDWTMADFVSEARRLASAPGVELQVHGGYVPQMYTAIWMHGGQVYDKDFGKATIDQPAAVSGMQFYYDQGWGAHKFAPTASTSHREGPNPHFGEGRLALVAFPPHIIPVLREKYPSVQWDLVTVPWNANKTRGTWLSAKGYAVSSGSKNDTPVQEAWNDIREGRKSVRDAAAETAQRLNALLKETGG